MNDEKKKGKQKPGASLQEDATQKIDTAAVNAAAEAAENGDSAAPATEKAPAPKRNRYADKMNRQKKPHKKLRIAVAAGLYRDCGRGGYLLFPALEERRRRRYRDTDGGRHTRHA